MSEDAKHTRLVGKVVGIFARHGASDIRACGDDGLPRPTPVTGRGVIVVPDVTAVLPDATVDRPAMAMSIGKRDGSAARATHGGETSSVYIIVRVETEARLEEPTSLDCWKALDQYARRHGAELWFAGDAELRPRLEELLADVIDDAVMLAL